MTQTPERTTPPTPPAAIDQGKLEAFLGKVVNEVGAAYNTVLTAIGDQLGLYRVLADAGPLSSAELAERSGTAERYVREWANAQAASGFLRYDPVAGTYELPPEQAFVLADDTSPVYLAGIFQGAPAVFGLTPRIVEGFRTGQGVGWHEHGQALFEGTERFFRSGYRANLVSEWIPALEGVEAKLQTGVAVADVGCGHGASTLLLAEAFPNSTFVGYDYHQASIDAARTRRRRGPPGRSGAVRCRRRRRLSGHLRRRRHLRRAPRHGRPARRRAPRARVADAGRHVHAVRAGGRRPVSATTSTRSAGCTTRSPPWSAHRRRWPSPERMALGAQAGPARLGEILTEAGFTRVREAARTPFNIVLEGRP